MGSAGAGPGGGTEEAGWEAAGSHAHESAQKALATIRIENR
jgi:hypothetical protein